MKRSKLFEELARVMKLCEDNHEQDVYVHECVIFENPNGDFKFENDEDLLIALRCAVEPEAIKFATKFATDSRPVFN